MTPAVLIAGQSNAEGLRDHLAAALVEIDVIDGSIGGSKLVDIECPRAAEDWCGNGPGELLKRIAGVALRAVWWVQGETEAKFGPVTEQQYIDAMLLLRERLACDHIMISPIAAPHAIYPHSRPVLAAQYRCCAEHGFFLGPEYYDLEHDREHLTERGRARFVNRAAMILRKLI